jgi:RNA polymerase sigma-70 factor (ECF subfamily)
MTPPSEWSALVARHDRVVWLSVLAMGVPADLAREVVQDAWAKLFEQRERGALPELKLPGLAIAQAKFFALDALRRRKVEERVLAEVERGADALDPERRAIGKQELARAQQALSQCSPQQRRVFHAVYDDPSRAHAEIAGELGLSTQRVRQIVCEVRRALRVAMEDA